MICLADDKYPKREIKGDLDIYRAPIKHQRGGAFSYAYTYSKFILLSAGILALRSLQRRYDLVYIHNMPDILVLSSLVPKLLGAKVILDLHDPMPELMTTIFGLREDSLSVRMIRLLEKLSLAWADQVITVNVACKRIFAARSCREEKIGIVMNAPDEVIFAFHPTRPVDAGKDGEGSFIMMYHGSIVERNGLDLAVQAFARVREEIPRAELRIYGKRTPFLDQVMADVEARSLKEKVHYLGPRRLEELVGDIKACDVGIIPNQRNAFTNINTPTRILEYLSMGKPVIAPRTPGILDYFSTDSLFFFESGDAADLALQIKRVYSDPVEAHKTAVRGQAVYHSHTWSAERATLVGLVADLLGAAK